MCKISHIMKILVVEDEIRLAQSLQKGLQIEHYEVDLVHQGDDALDKALHVDYDLIILDLMIPVIDGLKVVTELRNSGKNTPILILSAKSQLADKLSGFASGVDDYLTKPFSFEELLARIRAISQREKIPHCQSLKYDDLILDIVAREVSRAGQSITLTAKEFKLLEFFLRHQEKVLSKEQIIAYVWDYDAEILPNTVEVFIKSLRKKIDASFPKSKTLIQTIRGFGYKLQSSNV